MTDIQGSTRMWEEFPGVMPGVIKRHEELIRNAVNEHEGDLVKSMGEGDSTFSVFKNPSKAIDAAIEAQAAILSETWPIGISLKVRMAVHLGDAEVRDDDYFGPTINRCARIREIAHGGQVLVSGTVAEIVQNVQTNDWRDLGVHRLRDQLKPERIWQVQKKGGEATFPSLKSLSVIRNNLPTQLTSFIGRRQEVEELKGLISNHRCVSILGFGGEGKTRLLLQVGAEIDDQATNGVWFVPLDSLRRREEVCSAILSVLGAEIEAEFTVENVRRLVSQSGITWLLLDNAEHLIDVIQPLVTLLLKEIPTIRILTSSRQPLGLQSEVQYRILGLTVPSDKDESVASVESSEAGELFLRRAQARKPKFLITETNAAAIAGICRELSGVPLAIEHAASLVDLFGPKQILERLQSRLKWLANEDPNIPARHRSIQGMILWSYEMLDENEKALFLTLSLFRDTFSLEAASFMAQSLLEEEYLAVDLVRRLVNKSLVTSVEVEDSDVRFRLLETVRQFAQSQLDSMASHWMSRYVDWYLSFSQTADGALYGAEQNIWLKKCEEENANFGKALTWCLEHQDKRLLPLAFNLRRYWMRRGLLSEGRHWLGLAHRFAQEESVPKLRTVLNVLGAFASQQEDYPAALEYYELALSKAIAVDDLVLQGQLFTNIAIILGSTGQYERSVENYIKAINLSVTHKDRKSHLFALFNYSITLRQFGRLDESETLAHEALQLAESSQDSGRIAIIQSTLSGIAIDKQDFPAAVIYARDALRTWGEQPSPTHLADLLLRLSKHGYLNHNFQATMLFVGGAEALHEAYGIGKDQEAMAMKQASIDSVSQIIHVDTARNWRAQGKSASPNQLAVLALDYCEQFLLNRPF